MAVLRQANLLGQLRVDVPMLRQIEAAVAGDFDMLAGRTLAANRPLVIRGFTINTTGVVGQAANTIQLATADGIVANLGATESGSLLWVSTSKAPETLNSTTNPNVLGSFTPSATNNIGIDFVRSADASTSDVAQFVDSNTDLENAKIVPLARTLSYRIVITTQPFSAQPNLIPIATVVTTAQNNVASIVDARNMFGRLAPGGDFPSTTTGYSFTSRLELASSSFSGPDKNFLGLKDWADAVMTRIWEVGGGEAWFSGTADRNVTFVFEGSPFTGGEYFTWDGTNLHWKGLRFLFDNSTGHYNDIANQLIDSPGLTDLADGECLYVDLKRGIDATGVTALVVTKSTLNTLGTGSPPGSRTVFAWRDGTSVFYRGWRFPVGLGFAAATTTSNGVVTLFQTPGSALSPVVLNLNSNNSIAWVASGGNANGIDTTGNGTGSGGIFRGGATNGNGGFGYGIGNGSGLVGFGGGGTTIPTTSVIIKAGVFGIGTGAGSGVVGVGGVTGFGGYFESADGTNQNALVALAKGSGFGVYSTGGQNLIAGGPTFGIVPAPGPGGVGGVFLGGGGVQGGDGVQAFGLSTSNPKAGGVFGGSWPSVNAVTPGVGLEAHGGTAFSNADGGRGAVGIGGQASGAGKTGGTGGYFTGGDGAGGAVAGVGVVAQPGSGGTIAIDATGNMTLSGSNPATTTGFVSTLTPKNVCKAWAFVSCNGGGGITLIDGFNIASVSIANVNTIQVNFAAAMANTNYVVNVTASGSSAFFEVQAGGLKTTSAFKVTGYIYNGAITIFNTNATALDFYIVVYGAQ